MERAGRGQGWPDERVNEFLDEISSAGEDYRRLVERLPAIVYSAEMGEHGPLALRQPPDRGDPRLQPGGVDGRPRPLGAPAPPRRSRAGARAGDPQGRRRPAAPPPIDYRMITRDGRRRLDPRRGGARARRARAPRSGTASSTTSPSARSPSRSCAAPPPSRPPSRGWAGSAAGRRPGAADATQAVSLMTEIEGVEAACVWEAGREGRRLHLRAGLERARRSAPSAASRRRATPTPAPRSSRGCT